MPQLDPSDIVLTVDLVLAVIFALYFALGRPFVWYRDRLGWVIFSYALAVVALLGLIVYALWTGERIDEWARLAVGTGLGIALVAKTWSVGQERREGRLAGARLDLTERKPMSTPKLSIEEIKDATTIWYKAQRVLRTGAATLISALSVWAGFSAIWPDIAAQLARILPGEAMAWLVGVVTSITVVAGVITRIMAIPRVNAFLTKWIGLGSIPKSALEVKSETSTVVVLADDKAIGTIPAPIEEAPRG